MIILKATTETLQIISTTAAALDFSVSYADITTTTFLPSSNEGKITSATTTSILAAPAASTQRQVKLITISNRDTTLTQTAVVQKNISATVYNLTPTITLLPGETVQYMDGSGWMYYSATGAIKGSQTAGGGNNQLQYNNNGVLAGDSDLTWNSTTNSLILGSSPQIILGGVSATPATPAAGNLTVYSQVVSGKMALMKVGPAGDNEALQASLWQNNIVMWNPGVAAGVFQGTIGGVLGTPTAVVGTTTNLYTIERKSTIPTTTTAQNQVGIYTEKMFLRGAVANMGGFLFVCRFGLSTWTAGSRLLVGFTTNTPTVSTFGTAVEPSTNASTMGFSIGAAETAINFLHVDGSNTITKDVISGQPALAANNGYDAYIYCRPNDTTVYYRLDNALTGATIVDTSTTTTLPLNTAMLHAVALVGNAASTTAAAATIGINRMYIETNR